MNTCAKKKKKQEERKKLTQKPDLNDPSSAALRYFKDNCFYL
jgi:hypothetical protein